MEARKGMFYGWIVVLGAWLTMVGSAVAQFSLSYFQPAMLKEFGWTRGTISLGLTLNLIIAALISPVVGGLVDRIGPRMVVMLGGVIGAIAMALISVVSAPWHFYIFYGLLLPIGITMSYMLAGVATVRRWFMKRAALAVALAMTGSGLGITIGAPIATRLIAAYGWRGGYIGFGIGLLVLAAIGGFLLRKDPESMGQYPDGERPDPEMLKMRADFFARMERWSVGEAIRTPTFWLLIVAQLGYLIAVLGLINHMITFAVLDLQISTARAVQIFSVFFVFPAVLGRLFSGFASDPLARRYGRKPIIFLGLGLVTIAMFYAMAVTNATSLTIMTIMAGFGYGCCLALFPTYLGDLFGVVSMPVLFGWIGLVIAAAGGLGPWFYGLVFDATKSYDFAFLVTGVLTAIGFLALIFIRAPVKAKAPAPVT